jgi:hypothetical protein
MVLDRFDFRHGLLTPSANCGKPGNPAENRHSLQDFRAIAFEFSWQANVSGCFNDSIEASFVNGHDFSQAENDHKKKPGFSPCHISSRLGCLFRPFACRA